MDVQEPQAARNRPPDDDQPVVNQRVAVLAEGHEVPGHGVRPPKRRHFLWGAEIGQALFGANSPFRARQGRSMEQSACPISSPVRLESDPPGSGEVKQEGMGRPSGSGHGDTIGTHGCLRAQVGC